MNCGAPVQVWTVDLDQTRLDLDWPLLDAVERSRAVRLVRPSDRRRFVARRAALRRLLSRPVGSAPELLRFGAGPAGRPLLLGSSLDFNVSHSGAIALVALSQAGRIGVDLEKIDASQVELAALRPFVDRQVLVDVGRACEAGDTRPFFRWWTVVEAVAKARGTGIAEDRPPLAGRGWLSGVRALDDRGQAGAWDIHTWEPAPDCVATLALPQGSPAPCVHRLSAS